jgi:pimeloyl-ACP methyl ester carboxylesterase
MRDLRDNEEEKPMTTEADVRDATVTLGGLRFHYRDWGRPTAPALVILHGGSSFAAAWDPVAAALADHFRVVVPDLRGHGETDWAPDYSLDALTGDVERLAEALDLSRMALLGLSMGCTVAYCYAGWYPARLERLVLVDFTPDFLVSSLQPGIAAQLRAEAQEVFDDQESAIQSRLSSPAWASIAAADPAAVAGLRKRAASNLVQGTDGRWRWRYDAAAVATLPNGPEAAAEQWALVAQIRCPTLVVRGDRSPVVSQESAERLAQTIPTARWVEVADAGHSVNQDNLEGFLAAERPFLMGGE